jgi:Arc/MetJ family transcription regulator
MKMTMHIDEALLAEVMAATGAESKTAAVDAALRKVAHKFRMREVWRKNKWTAEDLAEGLGVWRGWMAWLSVFLLYMHVVLYLLVGLRLWSGQGWSLVQALDFKARRVVCACATSSTCFKIVSSAT